jgi:hypothetical protein
MSEHLFGCLNRGGVAPSCKTCDFPDHTIYKYREADVQWATASEQLTDSVGKPLHKPRPAETLNLVGWTISYERS